MSWKLTLVAGAAALAFSSHALVANACSTFIVGKDASQTGQILVGHNEDNGGRILASQYWVPAATHPAGEMLTYEDGKAKIPQVEKTNAFYWTQTLDPDGASFSDGFANEYGVVIVSNACSGIYDKDQQLKDGGIGYGIRRIMAERAKTARQAIDIATQLLGEYGYFSQGRTYTVSDAKEAWQIAIHKGNTWVARRVPDAQVVYIPNNFMIGEVDATDTENVIVSPGLIERSIQNGRYKPAKAGVYTDFNFRLAVQPPERRAADYNQNRGSIALTRLTGKKWTDPEKYPWSVTPKKKVSVNDLKALLRAHETQIGDDAGWYHNRSLGLCRATTHESIIYQMNPEPLLLAGWHTMARPCQSPYVPFYPLAQPAQGTSFMDAQTALEHQFHAVASDFDYRPEWQAGSFVKFANILDYQRQDIPAATKLIQSTERRMDAARAETESRARALLSVSTERAADTLYRFNERTFSWARSAMNAQAAKIAPHQISVLAASIDPQSEKTVEIVLYGDKTLDVNKIDRSKTFAGVGRASIGNKNTLSGQASPVAYRLADINKDGRKDLVMAFSQKQLAKDMIPGARYDVWFYTVNAKQRISAMDVIGIDKK